MISSLTLKVRSVSRRTLHSVVKFFSPSPYVLQRGWQQSAEMNVLLRSLYRGRHISVRKSFALLSEQHAFLKKSIQEDLNYLTPICELHLGDIPRCSDKSTWKHLLGRQPLPYASDTSGELHRDWLAAVGHVAVIPYAARAASLGLFDYPETLVIHQDDYDDLHPGVRRLLRQLVKDCPTIDIHSGRRTRLPLSFYDIGRRDGLCGYWESFLLLEDKGGPLISNDLRLRIRSRARDILSEKYGLVPNQRIVGVHVRTGGYHRAWNKDNPQIRDADINDYGLAVKALSQSGFATIRFGDPSMPPLGEFVWDLDLTSTQPNTPGQIDQWELLAACDFVLGSNSGWLHVAQLFNVPCAVANYAPVGIPPWQERDLHTLKRFRNASGEVLPMSEVLDRRIGFVQNLRFLPKGVTAQDNAPEEVLALTAEMIDRTSRTGTPSFPSMQQPQNQVRFQDKLALHGIRWRPPLGRAFLTDNAWLLQ